MGDNMMHYECNMCQLTSPSEPEMEEHVCGHLPDVYRYTCGVCKAGFSTTDNVKKHHFIVHPEFLLNIIKDTDMDYKKLYTGCRKSASTNKIYNTLQSGRMKTEESSISSVASPIVLEDDEDEVVNLDDDVIILDDVCTPDTSIHAADKNGDEKDVFICGREPSKNIPNSPQKVPACESLSTSTGASCSPFFKSLSSEKIDSVQTDKCFSQITGSDLRSCGSDTVSLSQITESNLKKCGSDTECYSQAKGSDVKSRDHSETECYSQITGSDHGPGTIGSNCPSSPMLSMDVNLGSDRCSHLPESSYAIDSEVQLDLAEQGTIMNPGDDSVGYDQLPEVNYDIKKESEYMSEEDANYQTTSSVYIDHGVMGSDDELDTSINIKTEPVDESDESMESEKPEEYEPCKRGIKIQMMAKRYKTCFVRLVDFQKPHKDSRQAVANNVARKKTHPENGKHRGAITEEGNILEPSVNKAVTVIMSQRPGKPSVVKEVLTRFLGDKSNSCKTVVSKNSSTDLKPDAPVQCDRNVSQSKCAAGISSSAKAVISTKHSSSSLDILINRKRKYNLDQPSSQDSSSCAVKKRKLVKRFGVKRKQLKRKNDSNKSHIFFKQRKNGHHQKCLKKKIIEQDSNACDSDVTCVLVEKSKTVEISTTKAVEISQLHVLPSRKKRSCYMRARSHISEIYDQENGNKVRPGARKNNEMTHRSLRSKCKSSVIKTKNIDEQLNGFHLKRSSAPENLDKTIEKKTVHSEVSDSSKDYLNKIYQKNAISKVTLTAGNASKKRTNNKNIDLSHGNTTSSISPDQTPCDKNEENDNSSHEDSNSDAVITLSDSPNDESITKQTENKIPISESKLSCVKSSALLDVPKSSAPSSSSASSTALSTPSALSSAPSSPSPSSSVPSSPPLSPRSPTPPPSPNHSDIQPNNTEDSDDDDVIIIEDVPPTESVKKTSNTPPPTESVKKTPNTPPPADSGPDFNNMPSFYKCAICSIPQVDEKAIINHLKQTHNGSVSYSIKVIKVCDKAKRYHIVTHVLD